MDKQHLITSLELIEKDIKSNDFCGAQMALEYLLKDFLFEGKMWLNKSPLDPDFEDGRNFYNIFHQKLSNLQVEHPNLFPRFDIKNNLKDIMDLVSDDGIVDFKFEYDHIYEDKLYNQALDLDDDDKEYNEEAELDMMFPNREDDDSWDE